MRIHLAAAALMILGAPAFAQPAPRTPSTNAPAETAAPAQAPPDKTQFDAYADKQRADLHSFVEAAKEDLDRLEKKETARLEAVAKRIESEAFADADKAKVKSLRELMTSSSAETREEALRDLKDKLRTERIKSIWTNYKTKKKALWAKFTQDWQKMLTQPPLMIRKKDQ
jgi:hypothetical protein